MKKQYCIWLLVFVIFGCSGNDEDCGATGYPPPKLSFEFIDEASGGNLLANGTWLPEEITVHNTLSSQGIPSYGAVLSGVSLLLVQMPAEGDKYTYNFKRNGENVFSMTFDVVNENLKCYTKASVAKIQISNASVELIGNNRIKVFIGQ